MSAARQQEIYEKDGRRSRIRWYENFRKYGPTAFNRPLNNLTDEDFFPLVATYFQEVERVLAEDARATGQEKYKIGIYCTSGMCKYAKTNRLAEYFWLTAEGRDRPEFDAYLSSGEWNLSQQLKTVCREWRDAAGGRGVEFDFNIINPAKPDYGQWTR